MKNKVGSIDQVEMRNNYRMRQDYILRLEDPRHLGKPPDTRRSVSEAKYRYVISQRAAMRSRISKRRY